MANHVRHQLRTAALAALTGLTTTGARVHASSVYPLNELTSGGPGLRIFTQSEAAEVASLELPINYQRDISLVVEACAKAATGFDDVADQVCKEVEIALEPGLTIGGKVVYPTYAGAEIELDGDGEQPVAVARMTFTCTLFATGAQPDVPL